MRSANDRDTDARLLVVGDATKETNKIFYPLHPSRKEQAGDSWWNDIPSRVLGAHDGLPDRLRGKQ